MDSSEFGKSVDWVPGFVPPPCISEDRILIKRMRNFHGVWKEIMLSGVAAALREGGSLFLCADAEWDRGQIIQEVESYGLKFVEEFGAPQWLLIELEYNCWKLRFVRPAAPSPREYVWKSLNVPDGWRVLDVGPGNYPLPRANASLEHLSRQLRGEYRPELLQGLKLLWGDIERRNEEIKDKEFDFVWASHVLEHLTDPHAAAAEISRIGKAGAVVCPSYVKEALFLWEEDDHLWDIMPPSRPGGPMRFVRPDMAWRKALKSSDAAGALCRVYRTGPLLTNDHRAMAAWYRTAEPILDVVHVWEGELKIEVLE